MTETRLYFVLPYINGGNMYEWLKKRKFFPEEDVKFYITQIVMAIGEMHDKNVIHRNLKLEDIMMCSNGYVMLIDYGMSKILEGENATTTTYYDTGEYMAPEMLLAADSKRPYGKSIDYWAIGILAYEMLFGQTPFYAKNQNIQKKHHTLFLHAL